MSEFKDMLKYLREREGLSQRELGEKLGISSSTISMYELGSRQPNFETEEMIADFFNVDLNTLRGKVILENKNETEQALRLYEYYKNAIPQIQKAVDDLLKPSTQGS